MKGKQVPFSEGASRGLEVIQENLERGTGTDRVWGLPGTAIHTHVDIP